jgi:CelD/BcsL family acetyltransferase involved in cellulose biosynthesis
MSVVEVCPICDIAGCKHILERWASVMDPMSDAAVEAVARAFCKRMGLDPDITRGVRGKSPRWRLYETRAREAIVMHLALKEVLG